MKLLRKAGMHFSQIVLSEKNILQCSYLVSPFHHQFLSNSPSGTIPTLSKLCLTCGETRSQATVDQTQFFFQEVTENL